MQGEKHTGEGDGAHTVVLGHDHEHDHEHVNVSDICLLRPLDPCASGAAGARQATLVPMVSQAETKSS